MSVTATAVRRTFGEAVAVDRADLDLRAGRITGLIGPNGSGKTTLLLMLAGLLAPDSGEIRVLGADPVTEGPAARARIGWMPDAVGMWESMRAAEILEVFARMYGMGREVATGRAPALLERVGLAEHAASPVRVLSRGQKQRLSLARALVNDPEVLLLDEPASGMDPDGRRDLRDILRELAAGGATVLVSSHVLPELDEMVDDVVVMRAGRTGAAPARDGNWCLESPDPAALAAWAAAEAAEGSGVRLLPGAGPARAGFPAADEAAATGVLGRAVAAGVPVRSFGRTSLEDEYFTAGGGGTR